MDMNDLYQDLILDHGRRPRHQGELVDATHSMDGDNPLCGDQLRVFLKVEDGEIAKASFTGHGCAISMAATSLMLEFALGKTLAEFGQVYRMYHQQLTGVDLPDNETEKLGKLAAFSGVAQYPMRVKCATLCWHTMDAALNGSADPVSTE
jgi:nitrogen fixation protein NifU and related proteins